MKDFLDLMARRFACKKFHSDKVLSKDQVEGLLEIGRLSPSSFGLEAWRFFAVTSPELIAKLGQACGDQDAVKTAPCVIAILIPTEKAFSLESEFLRSRAERFPGGWEVFREDYRGYYEFLKSEGRLEHWARAQTYIACANMLSGAAAMDIDSCAIEGFSEDKVLALLGKSKGDWKVGILASFGHSAEGCRQKIREPLASISEILD
jgi:nitroreductase